MTQLFRTILSSLILILSFQAHADEPAHQAMLGLWTTGKCRILVGPPEELGFNDSDRVYVRTFVEHFADGRIENTRSYFKDKVCSELYEGKEKIPYLKDIRVRYFVENFSRERGKIFYSELHDQWLDEDLQRIFDEAPQAFEVPLRDGMVGDMGYMDVSVNDAGDILTLSVDRYIGILGIDKNFSDLLMHANNKRARNGQERMSLTDLREFFEFLMAPENHMALGYFTKARATKTLAGALLTNGGGYDSHPEAKDREFGTISRLINVSASDYFLRNYYIDDGRSVSMCRPTNDVGRSDTCDALNEDGNF